MTKLNLLVLVGGQLYLLESFLTLSPLSNFALICYSSTLSPIVDEPSSIASNVHMYRKPTHNAGVLITLPFALVLFEYSCVC